MLRNTTLASPAMLTPQRLSNHANNTEIILVKLPQPEQLADDLPLLVPARKLGDESRVRYHRIRVEVCR